jgi:hypothetical protein
VMQLHVKIIKFQIYERKKRRIFTIAESQSKIYFFLYDKDSCCYAIVGLVIVNDDLIF